LSSVIAFDSAGVHVTDNPPNLVGDGVRWEVDDSASLVIGVVEGEVPYQLFRVTDATRLSDGRIAVLNGGTSELRFYDPQGLHLGSVGGQGDGPGEFRYPIDLLRLEGDTLLIWDTAANVRTWFDGDGGFIRSERADRTRWAGLFGPRQVASVDVPLPDGEFLLAVRVNRTGEYPIGPDRAPRGFAWTSSDQTRVEMLGWYSGAEEFNIGSASQASYMPMPLFRSVKVAVGGAPTRVYIGGMQDGVEGYEIHVYTSDGRLDGLIRHRLPSESFPEGDRGQLQREQREELEERIPGRDLSDYLENITQFLPPHGELEVDREGYLWVEVYSRSREEAKTYRVFDPDGRLVGTAHTPPGFRVMEIGTDYVLGVRRDSNGVEFVHLYTLERTSPGP
jgi:hypothetical protein